MNAVDKLMMQIGLQDNATKPLKRLQNTVTQTADVSRQSWEQVAGGAASLIGSGFAIKQALMPAIEMDRVLGEVKSLGVIDSDLKQLEQTALNFSSAYGKSATEVVGAAYDIKSAMGELSGAELAGVTESSAILAAATKADTAAITSYMGTLYSVFATEANAIGKDNWAERVAGMTAKSVEKFKTTGPGMADAFKGVGSLAKTHGVEMQNQMAILGMLQGSMSGAEAGTKYKAYLAGAVKAQDKLGLSFTDTHGKLLPMYDVLERIKGKFGELDSIEIDQLKTAFGSDRAVMVITDLIGKTQALKANIGELSGAANLEVAKSMAGAMTDQWQRLEASWFAIRVGAFGLVLPAINSVAASMADGLTTLLSYTQQYPNLTRVAGYFVLAITGGAGVMGLYNLTIGASRLALRALQAPLLLTKVSVWALTGANSKAKWSVWAFNYAMLKQGRYSNKASLASKAYAVSTLFINKALIAASVGLKAFGLVALKSAAMMLANPIFWIPAAVMVVGVAIYQLVSHWETLVSVFGKWYAFQKLGEWLDWCGAQFSAFGERAMAVWHSMVERFRTLPWLNRLMDKFGAMWESAVVAFLGIAAAGRGAWQVLRAGAQLFVLPLTAAWTVAKSFFALLKDGPAAALQILGTIPVEFANLWHSFTAGFSQVYEGIAQFIDSTLEVIKNPFAVVGEGIDWLIEKISLIPGIEMDAPAFPELKTQQLQYQLGQLAPSVAPYAYHTQPRRDGGARPVSEYLSGEGQKGQSVTTYLTQARGNGYTDNSQTMHTGDIVIKQEKPFTPSQLAQWQELATP